MPRARKNKNDKTRDKEQTYLSVLDTTSRSAEWIDTRSYAQGLKVLTKIHLLTKRSEAQLPNEQILQLEDGAAILEAKDLDELAAQHGRLRQR